MNYFVVSLAFLVLVVLIYKLWKPALTPKQKVPVGEARIYFFYTNWCGFSQKAMPEWEALEKKLQETPYFGSTKVIPVRVDCEDDRKTCTMYEVDGYPTIKLETSKTLHDYIGARTVDALLDFLRNTLGKEHESL
jgi:thiol-disulfide isomerase/thioredoxin